MAGWRTTQVGRLATCPTLEFVRINVLQSNLEFVQNRLQLVEREVMFPPFEAMKRSVRNADSLGELSVGEAPPPFS